MAEVDARAARGAAVAPITTTVVGKLGGWTRDRRLLVQDGGLIDAFAEVFASMSRRWAAVDTASSQDFGGEAGERESFSRRQASDERSNHSQLDQSLDSASDRWDRNSRLGSDDADNADNWSLAGEAWNASGQQEASSIGVDALNRSRSDRGRSAAASNQPGTQQTQQAIGLDQGGQEGLANSGLGSEGVASTAEGDRGGESLANAPHAGSDSKDPTARQNRSNIEEQLANRRRQHRTGPINDPNAAESTSSHQVPRHALKPASGGIPISADAMEAAAQGVSSSVTSPTTLAALTAAPTNHQVHALSSPVSGSESVPGARPAARNWSPSLDLQQNPSRGDSGAANGNASTTKSTSDVVARVKLIQRVSKAFQHLGPEGGSVRIRLAPAELGSIRVEMQVHDRRVKARVVAETESASTALREHLSDLRARLESYGMQVERLEVEVERNDHGFDPRQDANSQWQSPQQNGSGNRFTTEPVPSTPTMSDPSDSTTETLASIVRAANRGVDLQL